MLNISNHKVHEKVALSDYASGKLMQEKVYFSSFNTFLKIFFGMVFIVLFLPWTQNVSANGNVTTLLPSSRPQTIQSPIPGRIEAWYVQEGDFVNKGDTLVRISEIKSDYFDVDLLDRTQEQITATIDAGTAYKRKAVSLQRQISALKQEKKLKLTQGENKLIQSKLKVKSDSIDYIAASTNYRIAQKQFNRIQTLQVEGLKSVRETEDKRLKLQEAAAKQISQENKLLAARNEVLITKIELASIETSYTNKISKAESERFTALSNQFKTSASTSKLENAYANYKYRNGLLYITAPQDGYLNKVIKGGIGETIKEGEKLIGIMPSEYELAIETFIKPIDLPLIHLDEKVRVQFDGWPAIIFSGWPNASYGTFGAKVVAIENFTSKNNMYRVLLSPDPEDRPWPTAVRVGSGAKTIALLEDVPIWFELWRQINGFPPNYYTLKKNANGTK